MTPTGPGGLSAKADRHLWGHFARHGQGITPPIITRGEGVYIFDDKGKRYIDGLSGLFVVNAGHGRKRLAEVAAKQAEELAFFPIWSYAHPSAIELADRLAGYAPGNPLARLINHHDAVLGYRMIAGMHESVAGPGGVYAVDTVSLGFPGGIGWQRMPSWTPQTVTRSILSRLL